MRALVLFAVLAIPVHASAYARMESSWDPRAMPVSYVINSSTAPSTLGAATATSAIDAGFAAWAAPACTSFRAASAGTTTGGASSSDRRNTILFVNGSWPAELGDVRSTIGVTTPVWRVGGYFMDADIRFNAVGFRWTTTGSGGSVDTQSIATHEEGHFLGLDHTGTRSAIMYPSYASGLVRTLHADDQSGVCAIYPASTAPIDAGPPRDAGTIAPTDPCASHGTTCDGCTPYAGCGFCGATRTCVSGTRTGPTAASCAGGWAWYPMECAAATPDAGPPPMPDAGPPPRPDAGPPPMPDAATMPVPVPDSGSSPIDASIPPPPVDASAPLPEPDASPPPRELDAGPGDPPAVDAGVRRRGRGSVSSGCAIGARTSALPALLLALGALSATRRRSRRGSRRAS